MQVSPFIDTYHSTATRTPRVRGDQKRKKNNKNQKIVRKIILYKNE